MKKTIRVPDFRPSAGYFVVEASTENLGKKFWYLVEPLTNQYKQRYFEVKKLSNGMYDVTGEGCMITGNLDYYKRESEYKLKDFSEYHLYFIDDAGKTNSRLLYNRETKQVEKYRTICDIADGLECENCQDKDGCHQVTYDCPKEDYPPFPVSLDEELCRIRLKQDMEGGIIDY